MLQQSRSSNPAGVEKTHNRTKTYGGGGVSPLTRADPSSTPPPHHDRHHHLLEPHRASWITFLLHGSSDQVLMLTTIVILFIFQRPNGYERHR